MPQPSARPRRAARMLPAERRAQLLSCALSVFARRGLGGARHADVAAEAGVSQPAVFVYFPSRAKLIAAVLSEVERYYLSMLRAAHRADGPARDVLLAIARAFAGSVERAPAHARIWLDWSTAMREELWPRHLRFQRRVLRMLAGTIRRGQADGSVARTAHADDAARLMYAAAYAVLQMKLDGEPRPRVDRFLACVVDAVAPGGGRSRARAPEPTLQERSSRGGVGRAPDSALT